jgi:hypothetical protein
VERTDTLQQPGPGDDGTRFLGYRVFPDHRLLVRENVARFRRRMRRLQDLFARGQIRAEAIRARLVSWIGDARHADTFHSRERLFEKIIFQRTADAAVLGGGRTIVRCVAVPGTTSEERPFRQPQQEHSRQPQQPHRFSGGM